MVGSWLAMLSMYSWVSGVAVKHQNFGVLAGAELLGEHLVPVAELDHGHAVFGVFGGAQREVLPEKVMAQLPVTW